MRHRIKPLFGFSSTCTQTDFIDPWEVCLSYLPATKQSTQIYDTLAGCKGQPLLQHGTGGVNHRINFKPFLTMNAEIDMNQSVGKDSPWSECLM